MWRDKMVEIEKQNPSFLRRNVVPITAFGIGLVGVSMLGATGDLSLSQMTTKVLHDAGLVVSVAGLSGGLNTTILRFIRK
jgi:hypothetical protein